MPSKKSGQKTKKAHKAKANASGGGHSDETISIADFIEEIFSQEDNSDITEAFMMQVLADSMKKTIVFDNTLCRETLKQSFQHFYEKNVNHKIIPIMVLCLEDSLKSRKVKWHSVFMYLFLQEVLNLQCYANDQGMIESFKRHSTLAYSEDKGAAEETLKRAEQALAAEEPDPSKFVGINTYAVLGASNEPNEDSDDEDGNEAAVEGVLIKKPEVSEPKASVSSAQFWKDQLKQKKKADRNSRHKPLHV